MDGRRHLREQCRRDGAIDAALLDVNVDDFREVIRQRQIGVGLYEQQHNRDQDGNGVFSDVKERVLA